MKKALLYLLLFCYTTLICKPMLPFISDGIAHIFWYSEHMATVHYENGKYHVHYENVNEAKKRYPEKDANLPKADFSDYDHMFANTYDFTIPRLVLTHFSGVYSYLPLTYLHSDFPPPKA
ncbi:MAG: hypothetical protein ABJC98_08790 [Bacteroidota bacterium]